MDSTRKDVLKHLSDLEEHLVASELLRAAASALGDPDGLGPGAHMDLDYRVALACMAANRALTDEYTRLTQMKGGLCRIDANPADAVAPALGRFLLGNPLCGEVSDADCTQAGLQHPAYALGLRLVAEISANPSDLAGIDDRQSFESVLALV